MNTRTHFILCGAALCLPGCVDNINEVTSLNQPPVASARLENPDGDLEARVELPAPAAGGTVTVELDGTGSFDSDGTVEAYDWRSAVVISQECPADDLPRPEPWDGAKPEVELPQGVHVFHLWVTDDDGAVSDADRVVIAVGEPLPEEGEEREVVIEEDAGMCPATEATCLDGETTNGISDECRACTCAACPAEAMDCDEACWGLVNCVATDCGGDTGNIDCITTMCAEHLAGATPAIAIGPCAVGCTAECTP